MSNTSFHTTISDRRIAVPSGSNLDHYIADILSSTDYYPFGSPMPGRNSNSADYRFGFNGQEMDNEITGQTGTHTTAMFWEYDCRLGRRWNLDPKPQTSISDYACFANNPVWLCDVNGDTINPTRTRGKNIFVAHTLRYIFGVKYENKKGYERYKIDFALLADVARAYLIHFVSFGKLKIVHADTPFDAVKKIKRKLGKHGYISNMIIDYHSSDEYMSIYDIKNSDSFKSLNSGYIGEKSTVLFGHCRGGHDELDKISNMWGNARVIGNMSSSSSVNFALLGSFTGYISDNHYKSYYKGANNVGDIGFFAVSDGKTVITDQLIRMGADGTIEILHKRYSAVKRERLLDRASRALDNDDSDDKSKPEEPAEEHSIPRKYSYKR